MISNAAFKKVVRAWYRERGRSGLPWRIPALQQRKDGSVDPYRILVSEIMLQQTQVDRVIPKFEAFIKKFPTVQVLAAASLSEVLREWQGLGYNRRGKLLWECAREIVFIHQGKLPKSTDELQKLPGIGPYIAGAVMAFAYNEPIAFIETNIRTVYTLHFFPQRKKVSDRELLSYIEATLDRKNPREWYSALMDYGSHLKRSGIRINARNPLYKKQTKFEGSDRQIRGAILRLLSKDEAQSSANIRRELVPLEGDRIEEILPRLVKEGMIAKAKGKYSLA